jgi:hypothetical protein
MSPSLVEKEYLPKIRLHPESDPRFRSYDAPPVPINSRVTWSGLTNGGPFAFTSTGDLYDLYRYSPSTAGGREWLPFDLPVIVSHCAVPQARLFTDLFGSDDPFSLRKSWELGTFTLRGEPEEELLRKAFNRVNEVLTLASAMYENCRLEESEVAAIAARDGLIRLQTAIAEFDITKRGGKALTSSEAAVLRAYLTQYDQKSITFSKWAKEELHLWEH